MLLDVLTKGKRILSDLRGTTGQVAEGFTGLFLNQLDLLDPTVQAIYAERYAHCLDCPVRNGNTCAKYRSIMRKDSSCMVNGCGCNLAAKTKSSSSACPAHFWGPIDPVTFEPLPFPEDPFWNPCVPVQEPQPIGDQRQIGAGFDEYEIVNEPTAQLRIEP